MPMLRIPSLVRLAFAALIAGASGTSQAIVVASNAGSDPRFRRRPVCRRLRCRFGRRGSSGFTYVNAMAGNASEFDDAAEAFASLTASASSAFANANSTAGTVLGVSVDASYPGSAVAEVYTTVSVNFTGNGTLVVQVPYSLDLAFDALGEPTAYVLAGAWIMASRAGSETLTYRSDISVYFDAGTGPANLVQNDFLSLAVPFLDGESIDFTAYIALQMSTTAIPLPPALWLLGGALAFLGVQRRRTV